MSNYKTPIGLTSQFSFCGLPFRLDTYAGCALSCTYCFARLRGGNADTKKIRIADTKQIINKFENSIKKPELTTGILSELIRSRSPLHFGGMSDPFQPIEKTFKVSLTILKYLAQIQYPVVISTKSVLVSDDEYLSVLKSNPNVVVQFSFSTTIDSISRIVEPYSYKPSEILKSIYKLSNNGIKTTARWQPFIPEVSEEPRLFISTVAGVGVKHLGFEHLKLPVEKDNPLWKKLSTNLHFDIRQYYAQNSSLNDGREFVLPPKLKIEKALEVKSELANRDITFGSADNEIQFLSDTNCCCSGVDQFEGFENWNKFQIAHAVKLSAGEEINFDLIANEWRPVGSIDKYLNSKTRINKKSGFNRIEDYIIDRWENLNSSFNPTKFYGVKDSGRRDSNGFRIFEWEEDIKKYLYDFRRIKEGP